MTCPGNSGSTMAATRCRSLRMKPMRLEGIELVGKVIPWLRGKQSRYHGSFIRLTGDHSFTCSSCIDIYMYICTICIEPTHVHFPPGTETFIWKQACERRSHTCTYNIMWEGEGEKA